MAAATPSGPNAGVSLLLLDTRAGLSDARCPPRSGPVCFVPIERHRLFGDWCRTPVPLTGHSQVDTGAGAEWGVPAVVMNALRSKRCSWKAKDQARSPTPIFDQVL